MSLTHAMETAYSVGWIAGLLLFWLRTRRSLLLGAYLGCSLSMGFDWLLSSGRVWNLQFAPDTTYLFSWYGIGQPLWGPVSYGVFYGLILFAWISLRDRIVKVGIWAYVLLVPVIFAVNVIAEGSVIGLTGAYHYGLPPSVLIFHVPWMHAITTGVMTVGIMALCSAAYGLLKEVGWDDLRWRDKTPPVWERHKVGLIAIGIALPQAAYYASLLAAFTLYTELGLGTLK